MVVSCSTLKYRGAFLSLYSLMLGLGILLCYCVGAGLYWRYVAALPPVLYLLLAAGLSRLPESPLWLLGHRQIYQVLKKPFILACASKSSTPNEHLAVDISIRGTEEAKQALSWLRQTSEVEEELRDIQATMEDQNKGLTMKQALKNLARYDVRTPFLLIIANFFLVNFTGQPIMVFYTVAIFQKTSTAVNKASLVDVDVGLNNIILSTLLLSS